MVMQKNNEEETMKIKNLLIIGIILYSAICISSCSNHNEDNLMSDTMVATQYNNDLITDINTRQEENNEQIETDITQIVEESVEDILVNEKIEITNETENNGANGSMANNILVAYFSATGTTKRVAEKIAELTNADIYEIVPANPYSSADLNWNDNNSRSTKEMDDINVRPEIGSNDIDLTNYATIYLGYPIWWGDAPRIMSTFVEKYNFDGKTIIPFCTSGGSGIGRSGSNLANLAKTGNWKNGERLNSSADTSNIQNFINNMN